MRYRAILTQIYRIEVAFTAAIPNMEADSADEARRIAEQAMLALPKPRQPSGRIWNEPPEAGDCWEAGDPESEMLELIKVVDEWGGEVVDPLGGEEKP